jgi:hypothetical protein
MLGAYAAPGRLGGAAAVEARTLLSDARLYAYQGDSSVTLQYGGRHRGSNVYGATDARDAVALLSGPLRRSVEVYGDDGKRRVWMAAHPPSSPFDMHNVGQLHLADSTGRTRWSATGQD